MTNLVSEVKDVEIEHDVQEDLGADGQGLKTWGDVHKYIKSAANLLEPSILDV